MLLFLIYQPAYKLLEQIQGGFSLPSQLINLDKDLIVDAIHKVG